MMNHLIIPARYDSTRFTGKPLALINGLPMAVMTYRACQKTDGFDRILLLTDSEQIYLECIGYGIEAVLQVVYARNGTERIGLYALESLSDTDLVVNVQCDEPLMNPVIPQRLLFNLKTHPDAIWTAVRKVEDDERDNRDIVKCHVKEGKVHPQDFSRSPIPGFDWVHIGVYAYSAKRLKEYAARTPTITEMDLGLEQARWMEPLSCIAVDYAGIGVDRPEHIYKVEERMKL